MSLGAQPPPIWRPTQSAPVPGPPHARFEILVATAHRLIELSGALSWSLPSLSGPETACNGAETVRTSAPPPRPTLPAGTPPNGYSSICPPKIPYHERAHTPRRTRRSHVPAHMPVIFTSLREGKGDYLLTQAGRLRLRTVGEMGAPRRSRAQVATTSQRSVQCSSMHHVHQSVRQSYTSSQPGQEATDARLRTSSGPIQTLARNPIVNVYHRTNQPQTPSRSLHARRRPTRRLTIKCHSVRPLLEPIVIHSSGEPSAPIPHPASSIQHLASSRAPFVRPLFGPSALTTPGGCDGTPATPRAPPRPRSPPRWCI